MNPLVHFRWYRRRRGGVWGRHSSWCFPWKTWSRFDCMPADFSARLGDEDWRKTPNVEVS
ncbi:MAG: hypothetical protein EKK55_08600 [Rhodocyclaceae bacterium]|nr:MAG: hypothetical protein EKK55_08600 [Rhodocyclaceae bacterium]